MVSEEAIPEGPPERIAFGVVAPFDMELDAELTRWLSEGIDLLMTRTPFFDDVVSIEFAQEIADIEALGTGVRSVTAGRADVVAYACTAASFVGGRRGETLLVNAMRAAGARDALTTSGAIVEALQALDVNTVAVATPYVPTLSHLLDGFLREFDITVASHAALGLDHHIWEVPYAQTAKLIREADSPEAEAIVVSCTNLPTYDLISPLEAELGKPVITANQATIWATLRKMGQPTAGADQLLMQHTQ